jgi:hypothetical protein
VGSFQRRDLKFGRLGWLAVGTAVLLLAAFFRLVALQDVPPGLAQDEVLDADIASFIRGGYHAFFFRDGYGHEPLYHYLAAPFPPLFGDNVLAIRLPSVFLGLLLVALTLRWAKREFGGITAVTAGLGLAISWWPIIFSRIGIRPILLPVLLLLMAWFWPRRPWLAGLFLGLSLYSYTGARVVFLIPVLFAAYWLLLGRRGATPFPAPYSPLKTSAVVLLTAVLVSAPMFLTLWADPTLQQRVEQLAGPLEALRAGDPGPVLESSLRTLGVFSFTGDPRWTYTLPERPLFDGITALLFYAGLLIALLRLRQHPYAFALIWLAVGLIPSAVTPQAPSTVRLVGAMPVIYLLPGLAAAGCWSLVAGQSSIVKGQLSMVNGRNLLLLVLGGLLVLNGGRTVRDGLRWAGSPETRLEHYQATLLDISRHLATNPAARLVLADGFYEPIDRDTFRRNLGYDPAARWAQTGAGVAGALVLPGGAGEGRLYVPEYAPIPPELLAAAGIPAEPLYRSAAFPSFAVYALPAVVEMSPLTLFDERLSLMGYEILPSGPGEALQLFTWWRVERPLPQDLSAFIHLLGSDGAVISQHDGWDAAPATLQPGDIVIQRHIIPWAEAMADRQGQRLQVGLYQRGTGARLNQPAPPFDAFVLRGDSVFDAHELDE